MAADMAVELESLGITVVSLWPGTVKTEYGEIIMKKGNMPKAVGIPQAREIVCESTRLGSNRKSDGKWRIPRICWEIHRRLSYRPKKDA